MSRHFRRTLLLIAFALCLACAAVAQQTLPPSVGTQKLVKAIELSAKAKEPDWLLIRVVESGERFQEGGVRFLWSRGAEESIMVSVAELGTLRAARERLKHLIRRSRAPIIRKVSHIADDAYSYGGGSGSGQRGGVYIRKGKVVAWVGAPSGEMAARFARYIAEAVGEI